MPKTAVGLFKDKGLVDQVVAQIEALGIPRTEVRRIGEPLDFGTTGVLSIPRIDFEVDLFRELSKMGASRDAAQAFVDGVRRGGVLVFATAPDAQADQAVEIMNRNGAVETGEEAVLEPHLHSATRGGATAVRESPVQAGRMRQTGGACCFIW